MATGLVLTGSHALSIGKLERMVVLQMAKESTEPLSEVHPQSRTNQMLVGVHE